MTLDQKKLQVIEWIVSKADIEILEEFLGIIDEAEESRESNVVVMGYRVNGVPITRSKLMQWIRESEANMATGEYHSFDDVEKISQNW